MDPNTEVIKTQETTQTEERTFTQAELNAIVANRVKEVSAKYENYEELKEKAQRFDEQVEASKSDLQKATERGDRLQAELDAIRNANELKAMREEVAATKGVPVSLLTGNNAEECQAQADALLNWAKPSGYPKIPDGGDPIGHAKRSTRELFKEWFEENV